MGRLFLYELLPAIPDTPETITRALRTTPPKKRAEWPCLVQSKLREDDGKRLLMGAEAWDTLSPELHEFFCDPQP